MNNLTRSVLRKSLAALSSSTCRHKELGRIPTYGPDIVCTACGKRWPDDAENVGRDPDLDLLNQLEACLVETPCVAVVKNRAGGYLYMDEEMNPHWTQIPSRAEEFAPELAYTLCRSLQKTFPNDHIYYIQYPTK